MYSEFLPSTIENIVKWNWDKMVMHWLILKDEDLIPEYSKQNNSLLRKKMLDIHLSTTTVNLSTDLKKKLWQTKKVT
jgi:hypothetical protein